MPHNESLKDLAEHIEESLDKAVESFHFDRDELCLHVRRDDIVRVLQFLRDDGECSFRVLIDVCGVDEPENKERFEIVYSLLSLSMNQRVRLKIRTDENTPVPSVTSVFTSAGWFEREVWDMFGVYFSEHTDLRRILTDYGFEGHPLRKDFPLSGHVQVRYDEGEGRVIYEPVQIDQPFRDFGEVSPWEGLTDIQSSEDKDLAPEFGWTPTKKTVGEKDA